MPEDTIQLLAELGQAWGWTMSELLQEAVEQWYDALPYEDEESAAETDGAS
jgi:hypothetical protein